MAGGPLFSLFDRLPQTTKQRLPLLLVALLVMGMTWVMINSYIGDRERELKRKYEQQLQAISTETTSVIVANQDIPADTILKPTMFQEQEIPVPYRQPYTVNSINDVVGQQALIDIKKGEQIMQTKLAKVGAGATLSGKTPPGHRAIAIPSGVFSSIPPMLKPGDYIDIMWTFPLPQQGGGSQLVTVTLFQRVLVLAIGADIGGRSKSAEESPASAAGGITLALTPQESELMFFSQGMGGRLHLVLRPQTDKEIVQLPPTSTDTLLRLLLPQAAQQPQAAATPARNIEIFRGLRKEIITISPQVSAQPLPSAASASKANAVAEPAEQSAVVASSPVEP